MPRPPSSTGRVWIVGQFALPYCNASACRVVGLARALEHGRVPVSLIANQHLNGQPGGDMYLKGLDWTAPDAAGDFPPSKLRRLFWVVKETKRALRAAPANPPRSLLVYGDHTNYVPFLLPFARRNKVRLVVDVVEWPDSKARVGGYFSPMNWSYEFSLRRLYPFVRNTVVISRFLEEYYSRHSCSVVRIPPLVDCQEVPWKAVEDRAGKTVRDIVYAGSPGKKDFLGNIIRGINLAGEAARTVRLHVAGPDERGMRACLGADAALADRLGRQITCYGYVPRNKVLDLVGGADFSVLLRPDTRISNAGFPTKVAESLLMGTPVICNLTSDLADHIQDGQEGLVARNESPEAFAEVLGRLPEFPPERIARMRQAARRRAEESFDFRRHASALTSYFHSGGPVERTSQTTNPASLETRD